MTAPLCGSVSMPPLAIEATRCSTSIWAAFAMSMNSFAIAASAIDMPPEAEPVMPASEVTVTASRTSGLGMAPSVSRIARKPGSEAITPPKPYSDAVFIAASRAPGDRRLAALGESLGERAEGEQEHDEDAGEQRAFNRPD